jgi:hypothetical protein
MNVSKYIFLTRFNRVVVRCVLSVFVSSISSLFPSVLYHFLLLGLHSSVSASLSLSLFCPTFPQKRNNTYQKRQSVHWIRLMPLMNADTILLFCLTPAPDEVFWKGRETKGHFLEMPFSWMYLLYTALTTPWTRVISTHHATSKPLDDAHALELHITAFLM